MKLGFTHMAITVMNNAIEMDLWNGARHLNRGSQNL